MSRRVSEGTIREIAERISILDVISPCVSLKQAGKTFKGLCPFHPDKNPSFVVNPERNTFHCFGCGTGGDAYSFFMKFHNVPFMEAVQELARQAGVPLEKRDVRKDAKKEEAFQKAVSLNRLACRFYQHTLLERPEGEIARTYLKKRGVTRDTVPKFLLGYAPNAWDGLLQFLTQRKESLPLAEALGLILPKKSGRGYYDRFRNRLMFPILGTTGHVLAFGGRCLDEEGPKYINSPESIVYHKGSVLYGLHLTQSSVRERKTVILVEGYLDLIALHEFGFSHSVAVLGTALTAQQIQVLKRYTRNFILIFDGDAAGKRASFRNLPEFLEKAILARAVYLPEGEDPDSFLRKEGPEALEKLLEQAPPLLDIFGKDKMAPLSPGDSVEKKVSVLRELIPVIQKIPDRLEQNLRIKTLAETVGIEELFLRGELSKYKGGKQGEAKVSGKTGQKETGEWPAEERLVCQVLVQFPTMIPRFLEAEVLPSFSNQALKNVVQAFTDHFQERGTLRLEEVITPEEHPDIYPLLTALSCKEEFTEQEAAIALEDSIHRIKRKSLQGKLKVLNRRIQEAERLQQSDLQSRLFQEKQRLLKQEKALFS